MRLRYLFLLTFALSALLPAALLAVWVISSQVERELENTKLKQISLAKTVALALDHFAQDRMSIFRHCAHAYFYHSISETGINIARKSGFLYFVALGAADSVYPTPLSGGALEDFRSPPPRLGHRIAYDGPGDQEIARTAIGSTTVPGFFFNRESGVLPAAVLARLAAGADSKPRFLPVMEDHRGQPTIFIVQRGPAGQVFAGALDTAPIISLQRSMGFDIHGHAVVIDGDGAVLAHPRRDWERSMKSLADVIPAQRAINGATGALQFFAPARDEEAVAGYTRTALAGWGVLMVRPLNEVTAVAWQQVRIAVAVIGAGVLGAFLIAWLMTGVIVRPIESAAAVARNLGNGPILAKAAPSPSPKTPAELVELMATLNQLAERIHTWRRTAAETLSTVRAADQAKRDFLATLSHEIRTPLNAIIGFGELVTLSSGTSPNEVQQREYAKNIVAAGQHLLHLIDDILDLAAIEAGHLSLETSAVDLTETAGEVAKLLGPDAVRQGVTVSLDIPGDLPRAVADPLKLRQILINLVGNSIKFTPAGGTIRVSAAMREPRRLTLTVSDTGIGMTPAEIQTALAPFGRVRHAEARPKPGTGLGLPLARKLVETMNGSFDLQSEPGAGTTVSIALPVA